MTSSGVRALCVLASLVLVGACSSNPTPGDGGVDGGGDGSTTPTPCSGTFDCPSVSQRCFFPVDGHCTVAGQTGVCLDFTAPDPCPPVVGCGCDGTTISACAPAGYVDRTSNYAGACVSDGGPLSDGADDGSAADDASDAASE